MEPEGSLLCSQEPAIRPYPEPHPFSPKALCLKILILWHVDSLLGNDRETSKLHNSHCKVTAPQTSMFPWQQENTAVMEQLFSMQSTQRCYKEDQLAVAVSELVR
jgi:hypothetical protein